MAGYERTADQCHDKVKKLNVNYRKIKDRHNKQAMGESCGGLLKPWMSDLETRKNEASPSVVEVSQSSTPEIAKSANKAAVKVLVKESPKKKTREEKLEKL